MTAPLHGNTLSASAPSRARSTWRVTLGVALASAAWWIADLALWRGGTPHPLDDTWEYGLVARSLLAGHGFRTLMIHPALKGLTDAADTVPMLVHGPVLPMLGAPLLAAVGDKALDGVAWLAAAFAVIAAVFTARAVARALGTGAGITAAALVTLSPILLRMTHHDIAPAAGAAVVALLLDLLARERPPALATGLVLGLGALIRPELALAIPAIAFVLRRGRWLAFALGVALPLVPWWLHTWRATGSPFFSLSSYLLIAYTRSHPGLSPLWDFSIPPERWGAVLRAALPELPAKWLHFAPRALKHLVMAPAPGFGVLAGLGAVAAWRDARSRRLALAALLAAAIPFVAVTMTESSERYVAVFLPLWAAGVVRAAGALAGGTVRARLARALLVLALLPFTARAAIAEARQSAALRAWLVHERTALAPYVRADRTEMRYAWSDTPDFVAWTTRRSTIASTIESYRSTFSGDTTGILTWFHADVRATPAPTPGAPAAELRVTAPAPRAGTR